MSTHHGFLKEFPFIRVDAFDGDPAVKNPFTGKAPHFYLLTHAHTDHITGLNSPHFAGRIYATPVTKHLIENTMEAADRVLCEEFGERVKPRKKFANLKKWRKRGGGGHQHGKTGMDNIKEIQLNTPTVIDGPDGVVTVTAIDANHCPGSCMFLIEGIVDSTHRAVLITGDIRAEPWWTASLAHNPLLSKYVAWNPPSRKGKERATDSGLSARPAFTLDCVYLDTSCVMLDEELVTKHEAIEWVVDLMAQYPPDTRFFLNAWTWGYEELLKSVYRAFGEQIHLDWYKHRIYTSPSVKSHDPLLAALGSHDPVHPSPSSTTGPSPSLRAPPTHPVASSSAPPPLPQPKPLRFHACERRWKCDHVWADGVGCYEWDEKHLEGRDGGAGAGRKKLVRPGSGEYLKEDGSVGSYKLGGGDAGEGMVVFVNPSEMPRWRWEAYRGAVERKLARWRERQEGGGGDVDGKEKGKKRKAPGDDDGGLPRNLIVPLARHSTLPELQRFVALFRPQTLYPLTIADDRQHPARDYCSLPTLFSSHLAPGGVSRLRAESNAYRKMLVASKARPWSQAVDPSSADQDIDEEVGQWFAEPEWVREMTKKGLNIEGGEEVVEEVIEWVKKLEKGVGNKRRNVAQDEDEEEEETAEDSLCAPSSALPLGRKLSYGDSSLVQPTPSFLPTLCRSPIPSTSTALLPSPFLDRPSPPRPHRPSAPELVRSSFLSGSKDRRLRKSVTFAASPSPRRTAPVASSSATSPELLATDLYSAPPPPPPPQPSHLRPLAGASFFAPSATASRGPASPAASTTTTSSSAPPLAPVAAAAPAHAPPPRILARPSREGQERRQKIAASIKRSLQGRIGPNRTVVPLTDEELAELKLNLKDKGKGKGREESVQRNNEKKKENLVLEVQEKNPTVDPWSPRSFRTVSASTSPLA
ncbi:hypothetical protein JCM5296_001191 [Sporobolomyces johnsonii]